jgi:hypothetical protein
MALPKGTITVDVLPDGTVRVETGDMGGVDHKSADSFMADLALYMGGTPIDTKVEHGHSHTHSHTHGHGDSGTHSH